MDVSQFPKTDIHFHRDWSASYAAVAALSLATSMALHGGRVAKPAPKADRNKG